MAWVTPIGSAPEQIDYRLGLQHGCAIGGIDDAQLDYRTDQQRPLIWVGEALADLGIQAGTQLTEDQFHLARALVNGYHPHTGEQLVQHKLGIPRDAKVQLAPLVRMIEGVADEAGVAISEVLRHTQGRWTGRTSKRMLGMFERAQRAVQRHGETATLRADHAGQLADAAGLSAQDVWGADTYTNAAAKLTRTVLITDPDGTTTEQIVDNRLVIGNLAYDYTQPYDKDLSLLRQWAHPQIGEQIDKIFTEQALKTFAWAERNTAYGMRGHHGDGDTATTVRGNGFAGWAMIHPSARPTDGQTIGDPHWHIHFTIANMTRGEDGKWSTVAAGGRDLMRHAPAMDKLTRAAARKVMTEQYGITWKRNERTRLWQVAAIPDAAIREFSQRGADIKSMLLDLGFTEDTATAAVLRMVKQETRLPKTDAANLPDTSLREHYLARARAAGLDPDAIAAQALSGNTIPGTEANRQPGLDELVTALQDVEHGLTARTRRFSRIDAIAAVADALPTGGTHDEIEALADRVLEHAGFVPLRRPATGEQQATLGERRQLGAEHMANATLYTTQDILDAEQLIVATAQASHHDQTTIRVPAATAEMAADAIATANGFALSAEQHRELLRITTSGRALDTLVGGPGAGKTTLMDVVRAAYQAEGFVIAGTATQGTAGQTLQAESGIPSRTVAQWLHRIEHGKGLHGVDVLVLDEAAMTNDRDRVKLYTAAAQSGTKILEVGDPKQLRGVGCGSMFAVVHRLVNGGALVENRRQVDADERAAIAAWRRGDYSEALDSWADRDRLVVAETGQEATSAMLATWLDQRQGAPDPLTEIRGLLMVASTNEQVDRLNSAAQAIRQTQGELGDGRTYDLVGGRTIHLRENDFVMIRVNQRDKGQPDALNGYRGVVDRIHPDGRVDVRWDRATADGRITERATFTPDYIAKDGVRLGYALTIHKSQGMTVGSDNATWTGHDQQTRGGAVLFYGAGADNPGSFVATTRHKLNMWMFLARKDVEGHQDEHLLGVPKTRFERTRRVITKLIDRAKATEVNANDRPVMMDLGLLEDPDRPAPTASRTTSPTPAGPSPSEENAARKRAQRAKRDALETERRTAAAGLLREEWGEHPAVQKVTEGAAFGAVARWLDKISVGGGDPRTVLRAIDPDEVTAPRVLDPSKVTAAAIKQAAGADTTAASTLKHPPKTKAQRRERNDAAEREQREQVADLLREEWDDHPNAELVITGPAFGAVTGNLARATVAGHDPRSVLRAIDPAEVGDKDNPSAFAAWRIRTMTDPAPTEGQPDKETRQRVGPLAAAEALPPAAPTRLDLLVPSYERALASVRQHPIPAVDHGTPAAAGPPTSTAKPPSRLQPAAAQTPADEHTRWQIAVDAIRAVWTHDADWIISSQTSSVERLGLRLDAVRQAGYDPQEFMREALTTSGRGQIIQPNTAINPDHEPTTPLPRTTYEAGIPHPGQPGANPALVAAGLVDKHLTAMSRQRQSTPGTAPHDNGSDTVVPGGPAASSRDSARLAVPVDRRPPMQPSPARRDPTWPSWLPIAPDPQPLTGRERSLATAATVDAQRIRARVVELGRDAARERPDWVRQLGPAPEGPAARARYLASIATIAAYREQHRITGPDPIGPQPSGRDTRAYDAAAQARNQIERSTTPQPNTPPDKAAQQRDPAQSGRASDDRHSAPAASLSNDEVRQSAQRILDQQRRAAQRHTDQDPRRLAPGHGPKSGY